MKPLSISLADPNSRITSGTLGANMELARGVRNVMADINSTIPHFFVNGQFSGSSASFGPSKQTVQLPSRSVSSSSSPGVLALASVSGPGFLGRTHSSPDETPPVVVPPRALGSAEDLSETRYVESELLEISTPRSSAATGLVASLVG
jgi:hypothetical protein